MNKLGTKLGAIAMSAVMALSFAPSAAITSLAADGELDDAVEAGVENVYVVYNPNSGEHLFTTNHDEVIDLLDAGWGEGDVAWVAPTVAGDPVYRIYNPNVFDPIGIPLGDHHYTTDKAEADKAVAAGWKYDNDGEPVFYSADSEDEPSTAIYCAYNPNAYTTPKYSGAHHLTIDEDEYAGLVGIGWTGEGAKFYGYEEGYEPGPVVEELTVSINNTTPKVADTLTATVVDRNGEDVSDNVTFQWYADDEAIEGATDETLGVTVAMVGSTIKVVATAENGNTFESDETDPVGGELALVSVEAGAGMLYDSAGNAKGYNVLIAYFSEPVGELNAADVQIRDVSTNKLYSVEKVVMSSDQMTATLTLTNSTSAGASVTGLQPNIDYNMIVTTGDDVASKVFSIPGVLDNATVVKTDESKSTITAGGMKFNVPDTIDIDYEEILGRTVTIEYDKDLTILDIHSKKETVLYGAFTVSNGTGSDDAVLVDAITGEKYDDQEYVAGTSEITRTILIDKVANGGVDSYNWDFDNYDDKYGIAYGKLVLNSNGTVKALVTCDAWTQGANVALGNVLVTKVVGTTVYGGNTPVDMKDFVIVKDGKKITLDDLEEDDVVFFNSKFKFAEVYNDVRTGELEAVYDGRFSFGGTTYNTAAAATVPANLGYATRYIKSNGGMTAADNDYMTALKNGGEDITVYFDRAGQPVFISGTTAATVSNDVKVVLTENAKLYKQSLAEYIRIKGFNGTEIKTYDIDLANLTKIDDGTNVFEKGYTPYASGANAATRTAAADTSVMTDAQKHGGFAIAADGAGTTNFNAGTGAGTINQNHVDGTAPAATDGKDAIQTIANVAAGTMAKKSVVTLTMNDKGVVTAINYEDQDVAKNRLEAGKSFKSGLTKITDLNPATYQIKDSTTIYIYDDDKDTVKKTTLGEFTAATKAANALAGSQGVHIYSMNEKDVSWVVIESGALDTDSTGETTIEAVVSEVEYSADSTKKMVKLSLLTRDEDEAVTYTKFGKDIKKDAVDAAKGEIVTVKIAADGETVNDVAIDAYAGQNFILSVTDVAANKFDIINPTNGATTAGLVLASSVTPLLVKVTDSGVEKVNFAEVDTLSRSNRVNYSTLTAAYVDTIVVTQTAGGSEAWAANKKELDDFTVSAITLGANVASDADAKAAIKTEIEAQLTAASITGCTVAVTAVTPLPTVAGEALTATATITKNGYTATKAGITVTNPADDDYTAAKTGLDKLTAANLGIATANAVAVTGTVDVEDADVETAVKNALVTKAKAVDSTNLATLTTTDITLTKTAPVDGTAVDAAGTDITYTVAFTLNGYNKTVTGVVVSVKDDD